MRVLVTGARGFLGRHLTPLLSAHDVLSLERAAAPVRDGMRTVIGDLSVAGRWQEEVEDFAPEWCFHLAWEGLPDYSLATCRKNIDANMAFLETLARTGIRRVVVAGSCWEYGQTVGAVSPATIPTGCGVFAATKHAIRAMLEGVSREAGFDYRWARIFFVYGPGQRSASLIPHLRDAFSTGVSPSLREPEAVQDFVHVEDVARGLYHLSECDAPSGVFNLGSGRPTSVGEIANRVAAHYGRLSPFAKVEGGTGSWADISLTTAASGWKPEIEIGAGIDGTLRALDAPR